MATVNIENPISAHVRAMDWWCRTLGICSDPVVTAKTNPIYQPPPAPQTREKMLTWSPDDLWEATVQRYRQYQLDQPQSGAGGETSSPNGGGNNVWLWLALGATGAVAALILIRRI